jgi:hypothetical protein
MLRFNGLVRGQIVNGNSRVSPSAFFMQRRLRTRSQGDWLVTQPLRSQIRGRAGLENTWQN